MVGFLVRVDACLHARSSFWWEREREEKREEGREEKERDRERCYVFSERALILS
jgi:hypothetical protein